MKKTMQYGCALVLAFSTLPMVAQAAFTPSVPTLGEPHMAPVVLASNEGPGLSFSLGGGSYSADPQVKDDLFAGTEKFEKGATDVTNVNLDGKTLGMVGGDKDLGDAAHKLKFIVVHSYKYDKPGMYRMEDVEEYRKKLTDGSWNCFVHTKDKDGTTDVCAKSGPGDNHEMVVLTAEPLELTFVHLSGSMSFDELGKMGGSMGLAPPAPPPPPPPPAPRQ
jgi:hypothetical protein